MILGCTELSVIKVDEKLSDWYIDPMEILAEKVIRFAGEKISLTISWGRFTI